LLFLEQELVRAEAQSLVADAQLTNVTRQKFKEAYDLHTAAIIERAEKQILLAQHARRLLNMLDDTPIVPGEERQPFANAEPAREVLNDAETSLRGWSSRVEPIPTSGAKLGSNAMASHTATADDSAQTADQQRVEAMERAQEQETETVVENPSAQPPYPHGTASETAIPTVT